jgi:hypothetical protein
MDITVPPTRQEQRLHGAVGADDVAVVGLFDVEIADGEMVVGDGEGIDIVFDERDGLVLVEILALPGERQRGRVDGIGKVRLVAREPRQIDGAAHDQQQRDRRSAKEDEDVAALIAAVAPPEICKKTPHEMARPKGLRTFSPRQIDQMQSKTIYEHSK